MVAEVSDYWGKNISILNTPKRLERVENFEVKCTFHTIRSENVIGFSTSEEVVIDTDVFKRINFVIAKHINEYGEKGIISLSERLTKNLRQALLSGYILFGDEVSEVDVDVRDNVVQYQGEEIKIFKQETN